MEHLQAILLALRTIRLCKEDRHYFEWVQHSSLILDIHIRPYIVLDESEAIAKVRQLSCKVIQLFNSIVTLQRI